MLMDPQASPPKAIFFDAVGTLFGIKGSVGKIYAQFAAQAGVQVNPPELDRAFFESFSQAPKLNSSLADGENLVTLERAWWQSVAAKSFEMVGVLEQFPNFPRFFETLFDHFALAEPWFVYEDVIPTLKTLRHAGIRLGILSNFDSRLYPVLVTLGLADFFDTVTISTHVGTAKPEAEIFQIALEKYQLSPHQAWHIGDSWFEDVLGAQGAGLGAIWLNREEKMMPPGAQPLAVIPGLEQLVVGP